MSDSKPNYILYSGFLLIFFIIVANTCLCLYLLLTSSKFNSFLRVSANYGMISQKYLNIKSFNNNNNNLKKVLKDEEEEKDNNNKEIKIENRISLNEENEKIIIE